MAFTVFSIVMHPHNQHLYSHDQFMNSYVLFTCNLYTVYFIRSVKIMILCIMYLLVAWHVKLNLFLENVSIFIRNVSSITCMLFLS